MHRRNENLRANFDEITLQFGDTLLLEGPSEGLQRLFDQNELIPISEPNSTKPRDDRAWLAIAALVGVVGFAAFEVMPISALAIIGAAIVVVGRCLDIDEAHSAINWPILLLIFGSLALGKAMETSGAAQLIVDSVVDLLAGAWPFADPGRRLSAGDDPH